MSFRALFIVVLCQVLQVQSQSFSRRLYDPKSKTEGKFIKLRNDLPVFSTVATGKITLREVALGYNDEMIQLVTNQYNVYHSGIQIEVDDNGTPVTFILELWDNIGGNTSLVPTNYSANGAPLWETKHIEIVNTPGLDEKHWGAWFQSTNGALLAETVTGTQLNGLMEFVVAWINNPFHRLYIPFTVWPTTSPSMDVKRQGYDLTCDSFTEDFFWQMAELKITLNQNVPRFMRNYSPIISKSFDPKNPVLVDSTDPEIKEYYRKAGILGTSKAVYGALKTWEGPVFLPAQVGDPAAYPSKYYKIAQQEGGVTPSILFTVVEYSEMPLPTQFLNTCNKIASAFQCWFSWACKVPGRGGGNCIDGFCQCADCVFTDDSCMNGADPATVAAAINDGSGNNSMGLGMVASVAKSRMLQGSVVALLLLFGSAEW